MIKQLLEKSKVKEYSHGAFGEPETHYRIDHQIFAELIINKCVDIIKKHQDECSTSDKIIKEIYREFR